MSTTTSPRVDTTPPQAVREILVTHIVLSEGYHWPGGDGLTLEDLLHHYKKAAQLGVVPCCTTLCTRHPELATAIDQLFASAALND